MELNYCEKKKPRNSFNNSKLKIKKKLLKEVNSIANLAILI